MRELAKISKEELKQFYEYKAEVWDYCYLNYEVSDPYATHNSVLRKYWLDKMIERVHGSLFVDVGCAGGLFVTQAALNHFEYAVGVDISARHFLKAKKRARERKVKEKTDFVVADAERLPFRDHSFSVVLSSETLEHVPQPKKAVKELARISNKALVLSVPTMTSSLFARTFPNKARERIKLEIGNFSDEGGGHLHDFDTRTLKGVLETEGFKTERVRASPLLGNPFFRYANTKSRKLYEKACLPLLKAIEKIVARLPWLSNMGIETAILAKRV